MGLQGRLRHRRPHPVDQRRLPTSRDRPPGRHVRRDRRDRTAACSGLHAATSVRPRRSAISGGPSRSVGNINPIWSYAHVPFGYAGDATAMVVEQIERFAPGFRDRVVATVAQSTAELEAYNHDYVGGDIIGGADDRLQVVFRPRVAVDPYFTGVPGSICARNPPAGRRYPRAVRLSRRGKGAAAAAQVSQRPARRDLNHRIRPALLQLLGWQRAFRQPRRRDT